MLTLFKLPNSNKINILVKLYYVKKVNKAYIVNFVQYKNIIKRLSCNLQIISKKTKFFRSLNIG